MEIKQIIPADNWFAVYEIEGRPRFYPLVCWAIIDDEIVGMDIDGSMVVDASPANNFLGYAFTNPFIVTTDDVKEAQCSWIELAQKSQNADKSS